MNLPFPVPTLPIDVPIPGDDAEVVRELRSPAPGLPAVAMPAFEDQLEEAATRSRESQVEELRKLAPDAFRDLPGLFFGVDLAEGPDDAVATLFARGRAVQVLTKDLAGEFQEIDWSKLERKLEEYGVKVVDDPMPDHEAWAGGLTEIAPEDCGCELCRHHRKMYGLIVRQELRQAGKLRRR